MATEKKKQHSVPRSYLAAWTDPRTQIGHEPFVHVHSRDGKASRRKSPAKIFRENDLYTVKMPGGRRDLRLENGLQQLEDGFARTRRDFLDGRRALPEVPRLKLLLFAAAMHARTTKMRDHHQAHWQEVLGMMQEVRENMRNASPERRRAAVSPVSSGGPSMNIEQVRHVAENTMAHLLPATVQVEMEFLPRMRARILCAVGSARFITSDSPVSWVDPEWYKKPPLFRGAALANPKLEITMPISPRQCLLVTHPAGFPDRPLWTPTEIEYVDVPDDLVQRQNRLARFESYEEFVTTDGAIEPVWFDAGEEPDDSWEKANSREAGVDLGDDA